LDGDRIAHDANRGKGSYDKVMKAIRAAKEAKIPIEVATVLTRSNLNCIDLILAMAKKWGFTVGFTTLINQPSDTGKIPAECIPSNEQYREAIRKIIHRKRQGAPILFSEKSFRFCLNWPDYRIDKFIGKEPNFNYPKCYAGKYYCIIDVNGDVYPCPQLVGEMKVLNCLEHGLKKAWDYIAFHECKTCHMPCSNDFNYLFSLDIPVIINMLRCYTR
jgi:MoaA/NifB/PqqE/SkfB family radical SAM enzyme